LPSVVVAAVPRAVLMSSWCGWLRGGVVTRRRPVRVGFDVGRLGELFGKALVLGTGGVEVAFCPLGADL
jgi:hypothetical protein